MYRIHAWTTSGCDQTRSATAHNYPRAKAAALRLCRELAAPAGYTGYRAMASIRTEDGEHIETVRV